MSLTFGEVRKLVAEYAGRAGSCATTEDTYLFARQTLEHLLQQGAYGGVRKFCFITQQGCFTAPPELETPLKLRIDSQVANLWSKWGTMQSVKQELDNCFAVDSKILMEEPNLSPTFYDLPKDGSLIGVAGTCNEAEDAEIVIQGNDITGREILSYVDGKTIKGERIRIKGNQLRYGKIIFGEITHVTKTKTNGYVHMWALNPLNVLQQHFLADYSPLEEKPAYRRFRVVANNLCTNLTHISVLARIRLKENYTDNDFVPFESTTPILIAAQRLQAENNNDVQLATYKTGALEKLLENESSYKSVRPGAALDIFVPTSGGAIKNIIGGGFGRGRLI